MVKITMPKEYWKVLGFTLDVAEDFYNFKLSDAFNKLFTNAFSTKSEIHNVEFFSESLLRLLIPCNKDNITPNYAALNHISKFKNVNQDGEYDVEADDFLALAPHLDFIIRIWLGQWRELSQIIGNCNISCNDAPCSNLLMDDTIIRQVSEIRNMMLPVFCANGITGPYASFGIYSDMLHNDISILYGIYKAFRFAVLGNTNDTEIVRNADRPVVIEFPVVETHIVSDKYALIAWLEKYPLHRFGSDKSYAVDEDNIYVYFNDVASVRVDAGDEIHALLNGRLNIIKDGKTYNYRYMPKF